MNQKGVRGALAAAVMMLAAHIPAPAQSQAKSAPAAPAQHGAKLVMLGTGGGPVLRPDRSEPASLLQVDGRVYLVDAGDGVSRKLADAGYAPTDVSTVFLTHLHFDHVAGLAPLIGFNWLRNTGTPIAIYGPPETKAFVADTLAYLGIPEGLYRSQAAYLPPIGSLVTAHDIDTTDPVVIYRDDAVRVTAVENSHYATLAPANRARGGKRSYAYRFDTTYRSFVFTGDTGPSASVAKLARGADVLVCEIEDLDHAIAYVMSAPGPEAAKTAAIAHMRQEHMSPEEVGALATAAGVRMVVLNHVSSDDRKGPDATDLAQAVRKSFKGVVVLANDGDEF